MCGRYTLHTEKEVLARRFEIELDELAPRYNIAPTDSVWTVRLGHEGRVAASMRWGLIPFWAKEKERLPLWINARVESAPERPAFREAFRRRRCLVLADGFYEWQPGRGRGKPKLPHWIARADRAPFAMAGLFSVWRPTEQLVPQKLWSCAILTAPANPLVAELHDRMPVILRPEHEAAWLDPALDGRVDALRELLTPLPAEALTAHPVSPRVNSTRNDDANLIELCDADPQLGFFEG